MVVSTIGTQTATQAAAAAAAGTGGSATTPTPTRPWRHRKDPAAAFPSAGATTARRMKCASVACLWPDAPPPHRVTSAAVLPGDRSLYTGGSDGSIVRWDLDSGDGAGPGEIVPLALLCGHAAPVVGFAICSSPAPGAASGLVSPDATALLSACADGVLCVWSNSSGRCRRRRKLPPWAGTPVFVAPFPLSPRQVCIFCSCADAPGHHHLSEGHKSAIVIVDSWSLNVLQTVFHGNLTIGPVKAMSVAPVMDERGGMIQDVILVDDHGRVQVFTVTESDNQGETFPPKSPSVDIPRSVSGEDFIQAAQAVAISGDGKLLALIFGTCCVFRSAFGGVTIGEISLDDSSICIESPQKSQISGVMFLEESSDLKLNSSTGSLVRTVVIWNSGGMAVVYRISNSDCAFKFKSWCKVTSFPIVHQLERSVHFCQLNSSLVQIQSICFRTADSLLWKPYIMTWSDLELGSAMNEKSRIPCLNLLGEGGFPGDSIESLCTLDRNGIEEGLNNSLGHSLVVENKDKCSNGFGQAKRTVSSSMILSEDFFAPYAVVYGFYTGEIEVVQFTNIYSKENSNVGSGNHLVYPQISELFFLGHTSAVLCLATHRMVAETGEHNFKRVLISGSMDCTVRIWDFDTGSLVSVLHHHISPVRQIILPPHGTYRPWYNCFLSVGDDYCVALVSLETLRVERMFPGHPIYPSMVAWDSTKGYIACLCRNLSSSSDAVSVLYLWDVKSGARERIIRGAASHSMFDHFCRGINKNSISGSILGGTTSASSLLPVFKDTTFSESRTKADKGVNLMSQASRSHKSMETFDSPNSHGKDISGKVPHLDARGTSHDVAGRQAKSHIDFEKKHPVKCSCPFPGIAALKFDLPCLMSPFSVQSRDKYGIFHVSQHDSAELSIPHGASTSDFQEVENQSIKESLERCLVRFSLCLLHLWDVDNELDKLLMDEMNVQKLEGCHITSGLLGDRGTLTLMFPGLRATLELWKSSSEFCAMRSLAMVSLAQRMISISHTCTTASSSLAAFYTRNFADKFQDIKPPSLQLLVSFWQDPSEHIRMAARSLFHCAAPRAIPYPLFGHIAGTPKGPSSPSGVVRENDFAYTGNGLLSRSEDADRLTQRLVAPESEMSNMITWLESYEFQEWILWTKGTNQDATASNIIVAAALVVWYPSLVKSALPNLVVNHLIKLVMSMNDRYSSTAAELLAEGMESTWKDCLGPELPHLLGDIFFQIECLSVTTTNKGIKNQAVTITIREALVEILLPSLAMADIMVFLNHIEGQIWATSSDSPVHLVSLKTLIRVARGAPKALAPYLDKAIHFVLLTMDPSNLVMRKACLNSCMIALKEIARIFPMIALNEALTRLAVGDAIGDTKTAIIRVYDIESVTKIKILDASAPPGLPVLLQGSSNPRITTPITALTFSPDGEGVVAFSENGLMIRWWSLGSAWWEKLSRSLVPVPCTKLIFVPPWEGFSPNSSRTSIMAFNAGHDKYASSQDKSELDEADLLKLLIHNLDLSYRLQWIDGRKVKLVRHGQDLGIFQL